MWFTLKERKTLDFFLLLSVVVVLLAEFWLLLNPESTQSKTEAWASENASESERRPLKCGLGTGLRTLACDKCRRAMLSLCGSPPSRRAVWVHAAPVSGPRGASARAPSAPETPVPPTAPAAPSPGPPASGGAGTAPSGAAPPATTAPLYDLARQKQPLWGDGEVAIAMTSATFVLIAPFSHFTCRTQMYTGLFLWFSMTSCRPKWFSFVVQLPRSSAALPWHFENKAKADSAHFFHLLSVNICQSCTLSSSCCLFFDNSKTIFCLLSVVAMNFTNAPLGVCQLGCRV